MAKKHEEYARLYKEDELFKLTKRLDLAMGIRKVFRFESFVDAFVYNSVETLITPASFVAKKLFLSLLIKFVRNYVCFLSETC